MAFNIFYLHIVHVDRCSLYNNFSSAKRRLLINYGSIVTPFFSQFDIMFSSVAANSFGEMMAPCHTPLLILIF